MLRAMLRSGEALEIPPIDRVPVVRPASCGGWVVDSDLVPGDEVLLLVSDRDISGWLATGELTTPAVYRTHQLTDAVALAGFPSIPNRPMRRAEPGELLIGRGNGGKPSISLSSVVQSVTVDATSILLGSDAATRGVARQSDIITASATGNTYLTAISTALTAITAIPAVAAAAPAAAAAAAALAPALSSLGVISTSSVITKSL
jgi:hypothetical protein